MGLGSWIERAVRALTRNGRRSSAPSRSDDRLRGESHSVHERPSDQERRERARAWVKAHEAGLFNPPQNVRDAKGWDVYWRNHIEHGAGEQGFADQLASIGSLPEFLERRGSHTILCAGNGLSLEAISLAMLGFEVTALDISSVPAEVIVRSLQDPQHPLHRVPGFKMREDGSIAFETRGPIDPGLGPPMHRSQRFPPRGGGSLFLATGDLMNPDACRGPFDAVIERRTVQLFPNAEREAALGCLVARLASRGTFISQQHDGGWRPDQPRRHYAEGWLLSHGFVFRSPEQDEESAQPIRVAWLLFTSG